MKLLKRILKKESGQVLPMALIMLVLGGLLVVPTLYFMTTNLTANRVVDQSNLRLYAADAGVEQVLWNIQYNQYDPQDNPGGISLPEEGSPPQLIIENLELNDKTVDVYLSKESGQPYKITSISTGADGKDTTVECLFDGSSDYSWLFDAAITSAGDVRIWPGTEITGDVLYDGNLTNQGTIDGEAIQETSISDNWPSADYLSNFYLAKVADLIATPFPYSQITISGSRTSPTTIPRLYRDGGLLLKGGGWARLDGNKSGIADATEANFLRDTDGGFTTSDVGGTVLNTTDDTQAVVTSYVDSGKLGISENIMSAGDTYIISKDCPVYVTGQLSVNPTGDCVIDLAGQTLFSQYDNNCSGDAIYLGPKTTLRGSGCFIAIGNITFQPNLGNAGDKLVGVDYTTPSSGYAPNNTLLLSKFTAEADGSVKTFSILCNPSASGSVKLAIYEDNNGEPGDRLGYTPGAVTVDSGTNGSGLNDIDFPETEVVAGQSYWLAAISSNNNVICYRTFTYPDTWESRIKTGQDFSAFTFPETITGLAEVTDKQYLLAGNALPFIFVMSINCTSLLQPNGDLYGSIAGNTDVYLKPGCTLELTDVPEEGLDFPGMDAGGDDDITGTPPNLRTYTIK